MTYQIPRRTKSEVFFGEGTSKMLVVTPSKHLKLQKGILTLFLKGHIGADFKMRINLYKDDAGNNILVSSTPVNNQDISRVGDWYGEIRFDFPANTLGKGGRFLVEFEVYDGYTYDTDNYIAVVMDNFASLGYNGSDVEPVGSSVKPVHRLSLFFGQITTPQNEKFFMVKMEGARLLNTQYHTQVGGNFYFETYIQPGLWLNLDGPDTFQEINGSDTTNFSRVWEEIDPDTIDLSPNNHQYYYDPETGFIQWVTDFYGFDEDADTLGTWILKYYLFFTEFRGKYANPEMTGGNEVVFWEPRLMEGVNVDFSQQNNFNGLLSISASGLVFKNEDKYFHKFLTQRDSFNNRQVTIWRCEGEVANYTLEFVGTVRSATLNDRQVTFEVQDILATLDRTYEDERVETWAELGYTITNIKAEERSKIVPRLFGKRGPYELQLYDTGQSNGSENQRIPALSTEKMTRLVNVSKNDTPTTSNNRTWSIGFGPASASDKTFTSISKTAITSGSFQALMVELDTSAHGGLPVGNYFAPGDTIKNGTNYGIIYQTTDTHILIWPFSSSYSAVGSYVRGKIGGVVISKGGELYYPLFGRDYSCSIGSGGDLRLTFTNNFEANHSGLGTLDPESMEVYGRAYNDEADGNLTSVLEEILGYTQTIETAAQFAPAQDTAAPEAYLGLFSYPDPYVSFTLPFAGEENFPTFASVVEKLLKTGMGMVHFGNDGLARYKSFLDINWKDGAGNRTTDYIDNQSGITPEEGELSTKNTTEHSVQFDLYDTYYGVDFNYSQNPNLPELYSFQDSVDSYMPGAKAFYKTNKTYRVESLADINASYRPFYLRRFVKLVCGRRAIYNFRSFTSFGVYLGDDFLISRAKILGDADDGLFRVVSISKGVNDVKLSFQDLNRFPGTISG